MNRRSPRQIHASCDTARVEERRSTSPCHGQAHNAPDAGGADVTQMVVSTSASATLEVSSEEVSDDLRNLLRMLEKEHVTAALDLAHLAVGQSIGERSHSFG